MTCGLAFHASLLIPLSLNACVVLPVTVPVGLCLVCGSFRFASVRRAAGKQLCCLASTARSYA